jgi:hypothetical protein
LPETKTEKIAIVSDEKAKRVTIKQSRIGVRMMIVIKKCTA